MKPRTRLALAAILLLALALRGMEARFGLPYLHHFDEPALELRSLQVLRTGDWNPRFFHYPSLLIYLNVGVDIAHYFHLVSLPEDDPETLASLDEVKTGPADDPWFISHPSFYLWSRWLNAVFGTAAVWLTFLLTRRLWSLSPRRRAEEGDPEAAGGDRSGADLAGLLAALVLATVPFHVVHSAYFTTDVPAATLALAVVFFSVRFVQERRPRDLALAALFVGLAASTKYNLASALLVPTVALVGARLRRSFDPTGDPAPADRPWLWVALMALPAVGFLVGTPYAVFDLRTFLDHAGHEVRHYLVMGHDPVTVEAGWPHLRAELGELLTQAGAWVLLPALAGLAVALRRRVGWLAFLLPALQLAFTARTVVMFHRNLMILYPFVGIAFGLGTVALMGMLGRRLRHRGSRWHRTAVATGWALVALLLGIRTVQVFAVSWTTATTPETRSRAVDRINARAAETGSFAVHIAAELELHPLDLERLEVPYQVQPLADIACQPEPGSRVLVPQRVTTWIPKHQPAVDRLTNLLERTGPEVFALPGRNTVLTHFSTNPAVALRQPWSWPDSGLRPLECANPPRTALKPVDGPAAVDGEAVVLGAGGRAVSPFFTTPGGSLLATWNDTGPATGPRLRARVVLRDPEGREKTLAEELYDPHPQGRRRRLTFDLPGAGEVGVHFEAVAGTEDGGDRVRVRRLWLVPSDHVSSEPGG